MATSTLYIDLTIDSDGYVVVHDTTDYEGEGENIYNFALVEAVFDENMNVIASEIVDIKKTLKKYSRKEEYEPFHFNEWYKSFALPKDGEYTFMKMVLPKKEHVTGEFNEYYVDGKNVYYGTEECGGKVVSLKELYVAAFEENQPGFDEASIYADILFCIAHLNHCLLGIEKQLLEGYDCKQSGSCNSSKNTISDLKYNRDILLDAHRVLIWLLSKKNYADAKVILNKMNRCGGLCSSYTIKPSVGCGCGKSV